MGGLGAIHCLRKGPEGEGGVGKISTYSYFGEGVVQTHSYVIFSMSMFYNRNHAVKCFGRDHISFASGRKNVLGWAVFHLIYVKLGVLM